MYLTWVNYIDNDLKEIEIATTCKSFDELNGELNVKIVN